MVRFVDHFWGERNKGFDELILNFKKSCLSIEEFNKFLVESTNAQVAYCRSLHRLASCLTHKFTVSSCFYPIGDALRQFIEETAVVHNGVIDTFQRLSEQTGKYQGEQKLRQKQLKDEESETADLIALLNSTQNSLLKAKQTYHNSCAELQRLQSLDINGTSQSGSKLIDKLEAKIRLSEAEYRNLIARYSDVKTRFEIKFTQSCNKFQGIEESHLKTMKNFCIAYGDAFLACSESLREIRRQFVSRCDQLSIDDILLGFVHARKTGTKRPTELFFERYNPNKDEINSKPSDQGHTDSVSNSRKVQTPLSSGPFRSIGRWRSKESNSFIKISRKQRGVAADSRNAGSQLDLVVRPRTADIESMHNRVESPKSCSSTVENNSLSDRAHGSPESNRTQALSSFPNWSDSSSSSSDGSFGSDNETLRGDDESGKIRIHIRPLHGQEAQSSESLHAIEDVFLHNMPARRDDQRTLRSVSALSFFQTPTGSTQIRSNDEMSGHTPSSASESSQDKHAVSDGGAKEETWFTSDETLSPKEDDISAISERWSTAPTEDASGFDPWAHYPFPTFPATESPSEFSTRCSSSMSNGEYALPPVPPVDAPLTPVEVGLFERFDPETCTVHGSIALSIGNDKVSTIDPNSYLEFLIHGISQTSRLLVNRKLRSRSVSQTDGLQSDDSKSYELKLSNLLNSSSPKCDGLCYNITVAKYTRCIDTIDKWIFLKSSYALQVEGVTLELEVTALEELSRLRVTFMCNLRLDPDVLDADHNVTALSNSVYEWQPTDHTLHPGEARTLNLQSGHSSDEVNLEIRSVSFLMAKTASLACELDKPFGEAIQFEMGTCSLGYKLKRMLYKIELGNYAKASSEG